MATGDPYCGIHGQLPCKCMESGGPVLGNIKFRPYTDPLLQFDPATGTISKVGRDPALRKAVLEALRLYDQWQVTSIGTESYEAFCKAMDALREELAK